MAFDVGGRAGTHNVFVATLPSCELRSYWRFTTSIHEAWLFLNIGTYVAVQLASDDRRWQLTRLRSVVALDKLVDDHSGTSDVFVATLSSCEWRNYLRTALVSKKVDCCRHVNKLLTNNIVSMKRDCFWRFKTPLTTIGGMWLRSAGRAGACLSRGLSFKNITWLLKNIDE